MSHFNFTLPGNHIPLLHADCFQNPTHQQALALSPSTSITLAPRLSRGPEGRAVTSASCICREIDLRCAQLTTMRGRAGAKRAAEPGGEGTRRFRGGKQHLGAALTPGILRAPAARHSVPAAVTRAATPPTATAPTAIKRRFSHFQRLCGNGRCWEGFRSWVGQQHLQTTWHEKVVSQTCSAPPGCTQLP